ncbi:MAG TPA: ACP S-malonyltransferase [Candidatus Methylomirabilis sp.]|jgi:[acyl-carrier-protein] S-malonyltransferase
MAGSKKVAFLFPGQGSQAVGMGRALAEASPAGRARFAAADAALGVDLSRLCFEGPLTELTRTANAQPAVLTASVVAADALAAAGLRPDVVAGHSLGEYSALVVAGALDFAEAVRIVRARGTFMQEAVPEGQGAMAAILGVPAAAIREACAEAEREGLGVVDVANLNAPDQTVISGAVAAVERAMALCKARDAKRAVRLQVSAPFHCRLLQPAADRLAEVLRGLRVGPLRVPLVRNVDAGPMTDPSEVVPSLVRQVCAPVLWEPSIRRLLKDGVEVFIEVGPGKVLTGLVKRIADGAAAYAVEDPAGVRALCEALA